jgi:hypothetical protein
MFIAAPICIHNPRARRLDASAPDYLHKKFPKSAKKDMGMIFGCGCSNRRASSVVLPSLK